MRRLVLCFFCFLTLVPAFSRTKVTVSVRETAQAVKGCGERYIVQGNYRGGVFNSGVAEYALASGDKAILDRLVEQLLAIGRGEYPMYARNNFLHTPAGGVGAYMLAWHGCEVLKPQVLANHAYMWENQPRSSDGVMNAIHNRKDNRIFVDMLATVAPTNLYGGLLAGEPGHVDYAVKTTLYVLKDVLYDKSTGLVHQARGWGDPAHISEDCWSRGQGWVARALMCLMRDLPANHPQRAEMEAFCASFFKSLVKFQDKNGLWHQEVTDFSSYPETSGSAFILAGLGTAIEGGILPQKKYRKAFVKGLQGLMSYIDPDGSVGHTCKGCLNPGKGTKEDYKAMPYYFNEDHAFGPVLLALAQGLRLGIETVELAAPMGSANEGDRHEKPEKK